MRKPNKTEKCKKGWREVEQSPAKAQDNLALPKKNEHMKTRRHMTHQVKHQPQLRPEYLSPPTATPNLIAVLHLKRHRRERAAAARSDVHCTLPSLFQLIFSARSSSRSCTLRLQHVKRQVSSAEAFDGFAFL